jgi:CBS domain-containing protein
VGEQEVAAGTDAPQLRRFMQQVLHDLRALERMLAEGMIEEGVRRIGAEQEIFLIDSCFGPAPLAMEVLEGLDDPRVTTELARFNLEFNLDPQRLGGGALSTMERQISELLAKVAAAAGRHAADVLLTGILPTLDKSHLTLDNMTPVPRYRALNDAMRRLRGGEFELRIKGTDELIVRHSNVMLEACNTSFQVHLQVGADEFAQLYNVAQAVAGPVLAAAVNSPLLFGRRLWQETRIALFQLSIDTRVASTHVRDQAPRVHFGRRWVDRSVLEIFQEDVARFRVLLGADFDDDPFAALNSGRVPLLKALRLHNGTVYRWNRPCYGIIDGKAHLRIENRVLPSGPTPVDEVANAAFWYGLMKGVSEEYGDIRQVMDFDLAASNFLAAARLGLHAQLGWPGVDSMPARTLICERLLPLAEAGLGELGIDPGDADRYLGVIRQRVESGRTGAQWTLDSLAAMRDQGAKAERLAAVTAATRNRQRENRPVHEWPLARIDEAGGWIRHYSRIEQFMTTDLFTVNQDELVDLVACMMDWEHIRHVPVEDPEHRIVGLVTHRSLLRLMAQGKGFQRGQPLSVSEVMHRDPITASPETPTLDAIQIMKRHKIGCLPIVKDDKLVGIVTERDFMNVAQQLMEETLRERG